MGCVSCGERPKDASKDFTKAVIEINNPETLILFRRVTLPASMGTEDDVPASIGKYRNVLLVYEANGHIYLYSSDGIPTLLSTEVGDLEHIEQAIQNLQTGLATEVGDREAADTAINGRINTLTTNLASEISTRQTADASLQDQIDDIDEVIPAQATAQNQLADKAFVNSSVATNTANYISDNGQPFTSLAALEAYSGTLTNNDYAFVVGTDQAGNTIYTRYKYVASAGEWAEEYVLNNSSFTAVQWAAINSNITSGAVDKLSNLANIQTIGSNLTLANGELSATDTTYTAGTGLNLTGTQFSVDTTTIAEKSDIPTKTSELVNDGADGVTKYVDASAFQANSDRKSIRGGYNSTNIMKDGTVSLGDSATASDFDAIAIGARAHAYGRGSIAIGSSNSGQGTMPLALDSYGTAIGYNSKAGLSLTGENAKYTTAIGAYAVVGAPTDVQYSVALGAYSLATQKGQVDISTLNAGASNTHGYNDSEYRLLTGLYDPQSAHDAATKGYVDPSTDTTAPTTSTTGRLGEIRIDTSTNTAYMCVSADSTSSTYIWRQITS